MNLIQSTILTSLPATRKKTPSGWTSFNAPCCVYNGESQDKRKRGGVLSSPDGTLSYHCFNCGFKASYVIGRKLNAKMRQLMGWLGVADDTIKKLAIEAMRHEEADTKIEKYRKLLIKANLQQKALVESLAENYPEYNRKKISFAPIRIQEIQQNILMIMLLRFAIFLLLNLKVS